jgi:MFS transporter, FHS family, L-fucose permease
VYGQNISLASGRGGKSNAARRTYTAAFALVVSLFFLWGVANNLNDILIRQFKEAFELSDFESGLVQSAFYLGYFIFAIPAALFMRRHGYKGGIILGLALYAAGAFLFYPAANVRSYWFFLVALFVIASGLSFLETSSNPLVTVLGPLQGAERRLNLAQAFNPLGSITGVVMGRLFILSGKAVTTVQLAAMPAGARNAYIAVESTAVQLPYLVIGTVVAILALVIKLTPFPQESEALGESERAEDRYRGVRGLLKNRRFLTAVIAQFFYVGAQVGTWSYMIRYAQGTIPGTADTRAADYLVYSLILFMVGRFAGAALMKVIAPPKLLASYALANVFLMAGVIAWPGTIGLHCLIATSFFMSIMFPTVFALGLRGLGETRKVASSMLVMAIIGGALLTPAMGALSGYAGVEWSMSIPLGCFLLVLMFATSKTTQKA